MATPDRRLNASGWSPRFVGEYRNAEAGRANIEESDIVAAMAD